MAAETHVVPPSRPWGEAISAQRWWTAIIGVLAVVIMGFIIKPITSDLFITQAMNDQRKGAVGTLVDALYYGLEPAYALVLTLVVSAFVGLACKQIRIGLQCAVAIAVTWVPVVFVKMIIERPRPSSEMLSNPIPVTPGDWSFPSGHTTYVTALAMMLMLYRRGAAAVGSTGPFRALCCPRYRRCGADHGSALPHGCDSCGYLEYYGSAPRVEPAR